MLQPKKPLDRGKLIRDKIPRIMYRRGEEPDTVRLSTAEFKLALFDKLVEEAREAKVAETRRELLDELADVEEVLRAIRKLVRVSRSEVQRAQKKKRAALGAFKRRVFLRKKPRRRR